MGITLNSMSGFNTAEAIRGTMEQARVPLVKLQAKAEQTNTKIKLVDELTGNIMSIKEGLRGMQNLNDFRELVVNSSDPSIASATVDKSQALPGSYDIEVKSLATRNTAYSNGFPDPDSTQVGVGYFSYQLPNGESTSVYVGSSNNTLRGLAKIINDTNMGIKASVINDGKEGDNPWHLVLAGDKYGANTAISYPTFYFLDGDQDFYIDEQRSAINASISFDGFEMQLPQNKASDLAQGVTFELRSPSNGKIVNIKITEDTKAVTEKVKKLIEECNKVFSFIQKQNDLKAETDTRKTLGGESSLRTVEARLREAFFEDYQTTDPTLSRLTQVGIAFRKNGTIEFEEKKFIAALEKDFNTTSQLFVGRQTEDGYKFAFAQKLQKALDATTDRAYGTLTLTRQGFESKKHNIQKQIETKDDRLQKQEESLRQKFSRLESSLSNLNSQGQYMAQQLGSGGFNSLNLSNVKAVNSSA